jgi:2-oxoglutarate ferredoxin oxidoreductase subunit beta
MAVDPKVFNVPGDNSWCPGCGNFPILDCLKDAVAHSGLTPKDVVVVSGIGQAAKLPHYFRSHFFNGLHGRALPVATAVKASNPSLKVICVGGDGDMYGEGGNHFLHAIRRNPSILHLVHNNMVYGLTKGQASPTSPRGMVTPVQVEGVSAEPFNPLAVAISLGASFVARVFCADKEMMVNVLTEALAWEGYALVDVFQPCVSFNKINTYQWFRSNTVPIGDDHDPFNKSKAMELAFRGAPYPVGVLYKKPGTPFHSTLTPYAADDLRPLYERQKSPEELNRFIDSYR